MKKKHRAKTLTLRPTQFSIGLTELRSKIDEMEKMGQKKRRKLVAKNPVPVVISPTGELYLVDHHHFVLACCYCGITAVEIEVVGDLSRKRLTHLEFWKQMEKSNWTYLKDQFGDGPRNPVYLPVDVRGLADDPYRSLAWEVRVHGGYEHSTETFAEFRWADFFRKHRLLDRHGRLGFKAGVKKGLRLARSPKASRLPGYLAPKLKRSKQKK